ncbi:conserved hypothetical protein [Pyrobaculum islandicum DSM 4184]|uniref:Uncharacterized protein n=1 Tax=Pyrobaculum islandicum (strain DSM 4184 / JCM 9189 / GEO3) TaxID=384616 RepID=A1RTP9_PYRIL|nr:hypothetical protein [Pyrobaculum islandicum]ABL88331.1 conserved hypothetical protein [Pyrobaculum islandicum DSM 4184]
MTSLELLIITAFALLAIFAAVPIVLQQIYQYQALVEARAALAFLNVLADGIESDMGAAYAQKVLNLPTLRFGGLDYRVAVVGTCGGAPVYNTTLIYRSQYLSLFGQFRGTVWGRVVDAPEPPLAVYGWGTSASLTPRVVRYGRVAVVLNITYTASPSASGAGVYYEVKAPRVYSVDQCTIGVQGVDSVVVVPVRVELR